MRNESVAVLDIRSYEVTFFLGSKGANEKPVFSDKRTEKYEGFSKDEFFDVQSFRQAVITAVTSVRQNYEGIIGKIYVGAPSAFVTVMTKGHTNAFDRKRKISEQDVDALFESGLNGLLAKERCIRKSEMYFTLGDNHKYFNRKDLYGVSTTILQGALCYYFLKDAFYDTVTVLLKDLGFEEVEFLPSTLAQSYYLLDEKRREGYAFLLDIGFLTSSISVVYGNGIVHEETFDCGVGTVLVLLMQTLNVDYALAEEILASANVSGGTIPKDMTWTSERSEVSFPVAKINDIVKYGLDELCENVENFFQKYYREKQASVFAGNPISITGEGVVRIAGASEHIAHRLNRLTEVAYPDLPYFDNPSYSSKVALLAMALSGRKKRGWKTIFGAKTKKK